VVLVGQNSLSREASRLLIEAGCVLLGPRPYDEVPAYYQHADVIVVPHPVNSFTESLDPIKGYECLAVGRPTVATPVAGMRDLGPPIEACDRAQFPERVKRALMAGLPTRPGCPPSWQERAEAFASVLRSARAKREAVTRGGAASGAPQTAK
jgi:glycosyltransferase involved in cell wall biosynthesis